MCTRCVCARMSMYVQNAHLILPPRLPQVPAGGNRDLVVPGPLALCWVSDTSESAPQFTPLARAGGPSPQGPAVVQPSARPAAPRSRSAVSWHSDPGPRRSARKLTEPESARAAASSAVPVPAPLHRKPPRLSRPERVPRDVPCPGHSPAPRSPARPRTRSAGAQPPCQAC